MSSKWTSRELNDQLFPSSQPSPFGRRLGRARGARIPIILVTGFLGAGKTTFIQKVLNGSEGARTAVIVNEFGEIGIDNALLRAVNENTVLLGNGCLCCSMRSDLEETLAELLAQAATGAIPGFDRVIVETSGLADPGPILQTFAADRGIGREFHLETILTVADAPSIEANLARLSEAGRQVVMADRILMSKVDLVDAETVGRVSELLARYNPSAEIIVGPGNDGGHDIAALLQPPAYPRSEFRAEMVATHSGNGAHSADIGSFTLLLDEAIDWPVFAHVMDVLIDLRGADLLRMKGLVRARGIEGPLVVHAVQHILHPPVELRDWPDDDHRSRLVFITRDIDRGDVEALFRAVGNISRP